MSGCRWRTLVPRKLLTRRMQHARPKFPCELRRSSTTSDEIRRENSWLIYSGDLSSSLAARARRIARVRIDQLIRDAIGRVVEERDAANSMRDPRRENDTRTSTQSAKPLYLKMNYLKMRRDEQEKRWWKPPDRRLRIVWWDARYRLRHRTLAARWLLLLLWLHCRYGFVSDFANDDEMRLAAMARDRGAISLINL